MTIDGKHVLSDKGRDFAEGIRWLEHDAACGSQIAAEALAKWRAHEDFTKEQKKWIRSEGREVLLLLSDPEEPTEEAPDGYCLDHGGPHPCGSCGQYEAEEETDE